MPNPKIRVGNWQEELVYQADRAALLKDARGSGATMSQRILSKVRHHKQSTELQRLRADGLLRFGEALAIQNAETKGCVSIDLDDSQPLGTGTRYGCTTAACPTPVLRSTWKLVPVPSKEDVLLPEDRDPAVVHYGQRFVIESVDGLGDEPVYLSSQQKTPSSLSKVSNNQDAYFCTSGGQTAVWTALFAHPDYRMDMEGKPVKGNGLVLLKHVLTNTPLASTKARVANDFGAEYEVCCHRYLTVQAKGGNAPEQPSNLFAFVTAPADEE